MIKQVEMGLSEETIGNVAKLCRLLKNEDKADVVRLAIEIAVMAVEAESEGAKIMLEHRGYTERMRIL